MKTVILGLFDDVDDARRVLTQLAASPLDLSAVEVVHAQPNVQRALAVEAGVPPARAVPTSLATGALVGGLVGWILGASPDLPISLAALGPLLAAALGLLVGAVGGGAVAAVAEVIRLPEGHAAEVTQAVDDGATAVIVRTDNLPTARAIRDLFRAGGARSLDGEASDGAADRDEFAEPWPEDDRTSDPAPHPALGPAAGGAHGRSPLQGPPREHALFVPPWRRSRAGGRAAPADEGLFEPPAPGAPLEPPSILDHDVPGEAARPAADDGPAEAAGPDPAGP